MNITPDFQAWFEKTFIEVLDEAAQKYPDKTAFVFKGRELTYRELQRTVNKLADGLLKIGIKKGDHVSVWLPNSLEWIVCKFAIIKAGGVVVPINTRYKAKEAEYILKQSDSKILFMGDKFLNIDYISLFREICPEIDGASFGKPACENLPELQSAVLVSDRQARGFLQYSEVMDWGDGSLDYGSLEEIKTLVKPSDIVNIQYTSGTTGPPKGAMLTHRMLLGAYSITQMLKLTEKDRLILPLPLFHCFANLNGLLPFIMTGASVVLMEFFHPEEELQLIESYKCTVVYGVPAMYMMMMDCPKFETFNLTSLRTGNLGGSSPPVKLVNDIINKMGVRDLTVNYGMTENSCSISATRIGDSPQVIANTVGKPFPLVETKIVSINDRRVAVSTGEPGLLYVRGPYVMEGYYKMPDQTAEAIDSDGWLNTGDMAKMDEQGNLTITGRHKDIIMPGGENVSPAEVENVLFEHPSVKAVEVIGVPDKRLGEVVMAYIILKQGHQSSEQDILDFCKPRMANFKVPKYIIFTDKFPMTPTGKIQKFKLREKAIQRFELE